MTTLSIKIPELSGSASTGWWPHSNRLFHSVDWKSSSCQTRLGDDIDREFPLRVCGNVHVHVVHALVLMVLQMILLEANSERENGREVGDKGQRPVGECRLER
eukprot:8462053-Pyramimonas_sp.AAC.2